MVVGYVPSSSFYPSVQQVLRIAVDRAKDWCASLKLIALEPVSDMARVHRPHTRTSTPKPIVCTLIWASVLCNGSQIVQGKVNIRQYSAHSWRMKRSIDS